MKTMYRLTLCLLMACGLGAVAAHAQSYTFKTLAGVAGYGTADGVGSNARFNRPFGVTVDNAGNIYVADTYSSTIRKMTPSGAVSTLAGLAGASGSADGMGSSARFDYPAGVAVDGVGNVYVADSYNHTIRKITPGGGVSTLAGLAGVSGSADGTGSSARFNHPHGVAVDSMGNVYVADADNHTIRKVTSDGEVSTLVGRAGSSGSADGAADSARFWYPKGVAVDGAGTIYVADQNNSTIRKVTPDRVVSTLAGSVRAIGSADDTGSSARFFWPMGITADGAGKVYVADYNNCTIRQITPGGVVTTLAGLAQTDGSADGTGSAARFHFPSGVAVDPAGTVYVADDLNCTIRKITSGAVVTTLAGKAEGAYAGSVDGPASSARFNHPYGLAVDHVGNVYVGDYLNYTIRQITPAGVVSTLAGLAGESGSADGLGPNARFNRPSGVAVDSASNLYVADASNYTIRKVTPDGRVSTLAGAAGISGSADGAGSDARFFWPEGIALDSAGTVYVADSGNCTIRKITPGGQVSTLAGLAGARGSVDGVGNSARFYAPMGLAVDPAGNVYAADSGSIRKISPEGVVITLAGKGSFWGSADGLGSDARFQAPNGVALDPAGNVYVADTLNNAIRKVTPEGMVSTLAGLASFTGVVDGIGSSARFNNPEGIAVDSAGRLYVADGLNNTIRLGRLVPPALTFHAEANRMVLCWPRAAGNFVVETSSALAPTAVWTLLTNPIGLSGDDFVLTNTPDAPARFYRLRTP